MDYYVIDKNFGFFMFCKLFQVVIVMGDLVLILLFILYFNNEIKFK